MGTFDLKSKAAMQRCRPLISQALVNIAYRARLQEQVELKTLALQTSEQRFRSFAGMASDWFWETDTEHRLSYVSAPGYHGDVLVHQPGQSLYDYAYDRRDPEWGKYRRLIALHLPVRAVRAQVSLVKGPCWMEINAEPCFDAAGVFIGYGGLRGMWATESAASRNWHGREMRPRQPTAPSRSSWP